MLYLCMALAITGMQILPGNASATVLHVDQANPASSDRNNGSIATPFKTINAAAQVAVSGDTVLVSPGIYREQISPPSYGSGVKYVSILRHQAIVKGSELWRPTWEPVSGNDNVYVAKLDNNIFHERTNPYLRTISVSGKDTSLPARPVEPTASQWPITLGQIFLDSHPLTQVTTLQEVRSQPGTWIVGSDGKTIILHIPNFLKNINDANIELTVRDRIFSPARRGLNGITIEGFIFEHCANQGPFPQSGMISVRSGAEWTIKDNVVRYAATIGIDIGSEYWKGDAIPYTDKDQQKVIIGGRHSVEGNYVEYNGLSGISGWNSPGSKIIDNIVKENNRHGFQVKINSEWDEAAGIKVHAFTGGVIEGNLLLNNSSPGIWIDNGYDRSKISRNLVIGSLGKGIFVELGDGICHIDHNIVAYTRSQSEFYAGDGIYFHDASNILIANNLLYQNARFGILGQIVSNRTLGVEKIPVEISGHQIVGNIFSGNNYGNISMPLPSPRSRNNTSNFNIFSGIGGDFEINSNQGRISAQKIVSAYLNSLELNSPAAAKQPELRGPSRNLHVSLSQWRLILQQDVQSIDEIMGRSSLSPGDKSFVILDLKASYLKPFPIIAGINKDYFGVPVDSKNNFPGPFVNMRAGYNRWNLWSTLPDK